MGFGLNVRGRTLPSSAFTPWESTAVAATQANPDKSATLHFTIREHANHAIRHSW